MDVKHRRFAATPRASSTSIAVGRKSRDERCDSDEAHRKVNLDDPDLRILLEGRQAHSGVPILYQSSAHTHQRAASAGIVVAKLPVSGPRPKSPGSGGRRCRTGDRAISSRSFGRGNQSARASPGTSRKIGVKQLKYCIIIHQVGSFLAFFPLTQ